MSLIVKHGVTQRDDEAEAVEEIASAIEQPDACLGLVFCSSRYNLERLGAALQSAFTFPIMACTTAGEMSTLAGYSEGGLVACSLSSPHLRAHVCSIPRLDELDSCRAEALVSELMAWRTLPKSQSFGLMLVDGLAMLEERTAAALYSRLEGIPLVGGSAGDDQRFERTFVYADGAFRSPAASLCLIETTLPFRPFLWQHYAPAPVRLVITEADPVNRRVSEIDGMPAAEAYARALGIPVSDLSAAVFAQHPVMLKVGQEYYIRAIQRAEPNGALVFYCAIDTGLVLTLGTGTDLLGSWRAQMEALESELGGIGLFIGFSCIYRRWEIQERGLIGAASEFVRRYPMIGFSTYGESYNGVHVNQTLTGVALGVDQR